MNLTIAAQINSFLAALVLLTAFGMLVQRRMYGLIQATDAGARPRGRGC